MDPASVTPSSVEQSPDPEVPVLCRDLKVEAITNNMTEGIKLYNKGEFEAASEKFSIATEYSVEVYGQFGVECFEPHYQYGRTLLEIARLESSNPQTDFNSIKTYIEKLTTSRENKLNEAANLDDSRVGNAEDVSEEEKAEIVEQVAEAIEQNAAELDELAAAAEENVPAEDVAVTEEATTEEAAVEGETPVETDVVEEEAPMETETPVEASPVESETPAEGSPVEDDAPVEDSPTEQEETTDGASDEAEDAETDQYEVVGESEMEVDPNTTEGYEGGEEEAPEEEDTQAVSWEVLEVARCIAQRQEQNAEWQLKTAKVLGVLGALSIVDESFKKGVEDLQNALELRIKHLPATDRSIASTHVEIADAYRYQSMFTEAVEHYEKAKDVLTQLLVELKENGSKEDIADDMKTKYTIEIADVEGFINDLNEAIEDSKSSENDAATKKAAIDEAKAAATIFDVSPAKSDAENATPINDITSAIRKVTKRPAQPDDADEVKKPRFSDDGDAIVEEDAASTETA